MFFWHNGSSIRIWNWHTGALLVVRNILDTCLNDTNSQGSQSQNESHLPFGTWDFAFLSPRAYMLPRIGNSGSIDLFSFEDCKPTSKTQSGSPASPTHVLTLCFPNLQGNRHLRSIGSHSAPYLGKPSAQSLPFYTAQNHRIHLLQLHYGDLTPQFNVFVKNEYFLDIMDQMQHQTGIYEMTQVGITRGMSPNLAVLIDVDQEPRSRRWLACRRLSVWERHRDMLENKPGDNLVLYVSH